VAHARAQHRAFSTGATGSAASSRRAGYVARVVATAKPRPAGTLRVGGLAGLVAPFLAGVEQWAGALDVRFVPRSAAAGDAAHVKYAGGRHSLPYEQYVSKDGVASPGWLAAFDAPATGAGQPGTPRGVDHSFLEVRLG
jgi:hypothetical protein